MRAFLALALSLLLSGCAHYVGIVRPDLDPTRYKRVYVINNLDDNHHIDIHLVAALRAQGHEADSGPETLVPDDVDAVLLYRDHWTWDFTDHLAAMDVELRDSRRDRKTLATAHYVGKAVLEQNPNKVAHRLIQELFTPKPAKKRK